MFKASPFVVSPSGVGRPKLGISAAPGEAGTASLLLVSDKLNLGRGGLKRRATSFPASVPKAVAAELPTLEPAATAPTSWLSAVIGEFAVSNFGFGTEFAEGAVVTDGTRRRTVESDALSFSRPRKSARSVPRTPRSATSPGELAVDPVLPPDRISATTKGRIATH